MTKKDSMAKKTEQELNELLADTRAQLRTDRFAATGARAKDSDSISKLRAVVARVLTEQREREIKNA